MRESLHEKYLPEYDFNEVHSIEVDADEKSIFRAIMDLDTRRSPLIRILLRLRGMDTNAVAGYQNLTRMGFTVLELDSFREGIAGLVGQFWKPSGNIQTVTANEFCSFGRDGFLKATWNFRIIKGQNGTNMVETETRIRCLGASAKRRFRIYWFLIKPFSGIIRNEMLKIIRDQAKQLQRDA
jgi:hypothetical protein